MTDKETTVQQLKDKFMEFSKARDWLQFHNPKNLALNMGIEVGELQEFFIWATPEQTWKILEEKRTEIKHEISDIAYSLLHLCSQCDIDLSEAIEEKMRIMEERYDVEKSKGLAKKYTEL